MHWARPKKLTWLLVAFGAALALALLAFWSQGAEPRALKKIPVEVRRALYSRQLESLKLMCPGPPAEEALQDRCRAEAEFLAEFPECTEECRQTVGPILSHPTR